MLITIIDYLLILLRIATYFYGFLLLVVVTLLVAKRREGRLFRFAESLAESYEEISMHFVRFAKILLILIALRVIINVVVETESYVYIFDWLNKALFDHDVIMGVFLASLLSVLVHVWLNNARKRNEVRKNSAMLYSDLKSIIGSLNRAKWLIKGSPKEIDQKKFLFHGFNPITEISHNTKWRDHYTPIHEYLPYKYYKKIDTLYSAIEDFNKAVHQEDIGLLKRCITRTLPNQDRGYVDLQKVTPTQLINALERLTKNKKVKSDTYKFLLYEFLYTAIRAFANKKIENKMLGIIREYGKITDNKLESEVRNWLAKPEQRFLKYVCWGVLPRLLFEVGSKSKHIKHIWDEYSLEEKQ